MWAPQHRILNIYVEFCAPHAKRMHQIVRTDFENYIFSPLLRGHIPLRHPLSPQAPKFCQSLIWVPPLLKNPESGPEYQQCQFFRIFRQKVHPIFFTISLGQFGPKTCSGRIALCALLHRRKLVEIEYFCIFSMQKRPSFYIRCCKIPVYRFYSKYHMRTFCHKFNILRNYYWVALPAGPRIPN